VTVADAVSPVGSQIAAPAERGDSAGAAPTASEAALDYAARGLPVIPVRPASKVPAVDRWTERATVDPDTIRQWFPAGTDRNVGVATGHPLPAGGHLIVLDVDEHDPAASGSEALADLEDQLGDLPDTYTVLTPTGGRHIYLSATRPLTNAAGTNLPPGIDVRGAGGYVLASPSEHPDGGRYEPDAVHDLDTVGIARLPEAWEDRLTANPQPSTPPTPAPAPSPRSLLATVPGGSFLDPYKADTDGYLAELHADGWTHHHTTGQEVHLTRPGKTARDGASAVLHLDTGILVNWSTTAGATVDEVGGRSRLDYYADRHHAGNVDAAIAALRPASTAPAPKVDDDGYGRHAHTGGAFILDGDVNIATRWGDGPECLWAQGEALILAGPPGVGKTTVAGQLVGALVGITDSVLGYPVTPARRVLYLAMDRPRQVKRALRRRFTEQHRDTLDDRLVVHAGPIPTDLGEHPGLLLELAHHHDCDVVVVDSLKDAAIKLTDDAVGGNVNRAVQACNAAGVDVLILHHQRKSGAENKKPTKLDDLYGSAWIGAGAGSVVLLWGQAGDDVVELLHLKPPADVVGPWKIEHDHHAGTSTRVHGFDALEFLRRRPDGATLAQAAQAEHGRPVDARGKESKRTERRLRSLVDRGLATRREAQRRDDGTLAAVVYLAVDTVDTSVDTPSATSPSTPPSTTPSTTVDTFRETPGQTVDTTVDTNSSAPTVDNGTPLYIGGPGDVAGDRYYAGSLL
jgi:replicative DNA helicase